MTFKLFNKTLAFDFRNGCGIDLEFVDGKAVWISPNRDMESFEAGVFVGTVILLPFISICYGKCFAEGMNDQR
tara:strand:+ start:355 stop:573 length:219 start_codon:yes stop_codon:yes gene_type:complete